MKNSLYILLAFCLIITVSCSEDSGNEQITVTKEDPLKVDQDQVKKIAETKTTNTSDINSSLEEVDAKTKEDLMKVVRRDLGNQKEEQKKKINGPKGPLTTVSFEEDVHDFGDVTEGQIVRTVFKFTNTGKNPLVITKTQASCGCTVPTTPKDPILPGEKGEIPVEFNTSGKRGVNEKTITIIGNFDPEGVVYTKIRANVINGN